MPQPKDVCPKSFTKLYQEREKVPSLENASTTPMTRGITMEDSTPKRSRFCPFPLILLLIGGSQGYPLAPFFVAPMVNLMVFFTQYWIDCFPKSRFPSLKGKCCTMENPCDEGEGDCEDDFECNGNLVCGLNNCKQFRHNSE